MRALRWKKTYLSGNTEADQHNQKFVQCLNSLIEATGQREHCQEIDEFLSSLSAEAEQNLTAGGESARQMRAKFHGQLVGALPLGTYHSPACRKCGLCDVAQAKIAEHLQVPLQCLQE